jgi:hypothetical protein
MSRRVEIAVEVASSLAGRPTGPDASIAPRNLLTSNVWSGGLR